MKIYILPGLGYDDQIFQNLELSNFQVIKVNWIEPESMKESIALYAKRLFESHVEKDERRILIGHSFGGMMAQEIAEIFKIEKIILVSSLRHSDRMPSVFKLTSSTFIY